MAKCMFEYIFECTLVSMRAVVLQFFHLRQGFGGQARIFE